LVVLHWLVVDRSWRRKGVGRVLVEQAEQIAWQRGVRRLGVETHGHWHPAVEFWQRLGYLRPGT
jgi:GNAT superfamily N-acetyltransferase